jgi:hypothetical protein
MPTLQHYKTLIHPDHHDHIIKKCISKIPGGGKLVEKFFKKREYVTPMPMDMKADNDDMKFRWH